VQPDDGGRAFVFEIERKDGGFSRHRVSSSG